MPFGWGSASPPPSDTLLPPACCQCLINGSDPAHHICQRHEILCSSDFARHSPSHKLLQSHSIFSCFAFCGTCEISPQQSSHKLKFFMAGGPNFLFFKLHHDAGGTTLVTSCTSVLHTLKKKIMFPWWWSSSWNCKWKMNVSECVCACVSVCRIVFMYRKKNI